MVPVEIAIKKREKDKPMDETIDFRVCIYGCFNFQCRKHRQKVQTIIRLNSERYNKSMIHRNMKKGNSERMSE